MLQNVLKLIILSTALTIFNIAIAEPWEEYEHFEILDKPLYVGDGKSPEVVEFFYYGCPHCFKLEPYIKIWLRKKPSNVAFYPIPATFANKRWDWSARLYYTAKTLNVEQQLHDKIFNEIHKGKGLKSSEDLIRLFATAGISQKKFEDIYKGFTVSNLVEKARKLSTQSQISGVPNILVNGKYLTSVNQAGGNAQLFRLVDWLLKQPK